ncbi:MAG: hypothetical protein VW169_12735 [Rhodospirillaceae bacterium]
MDLFWNVIGNVWSYWASLFNFLPAGNDYAAVAGAVLLLAIVGKVIKETMAYTG